MSLISASHYLIGDLSFDRQNIVLEIGMALAVYSDPARQIAVLGADPYQLHERISDLLGACQILGHWWDPLRVLDSLSRWLETDGRSAVCIDQGAARGVYRCLIGQYRDHYGYEGIERLFDDWMPRLDALYEKMCERGARSRSRRMRKLINCDDDDGASDT